jgi:hypothetical protein
MGVLTGADALADSVADFHRFRNSPAIAMMVR